MTGSLRPDHRPLVRSWTVVETDLEFTNFGNPPKCKSMEGRLCLLELAVPIIPGKTMGRRKRPFRPVQLRELSL